MKVISFFAGCGGLDLGFEQAGFDVVWANEFDKSIHDTYKINHPLTSINGKNIRNLSSADIPDCDGFIGGPPCQSWSVAGKMLGLSDERGHVFLDYIRLIKEKQPKFFLIENVAGIVSDCHFSTFRGFLSDLCTAGYNVKYTLINAADFGVSQERLRVFVVGFRKDIGCNYVFPLPNLKNRCCLIDAIGDISIPPKPYIDGQLIKENKELANHDYYNGPFDNKYMSRNRVRGWKEVSFTIPASAKNVPLHPNAPKMIYLNANCRCFVPDSKEKYRRLSIRECARIQSFPDDFLFCYNEIKEGYKMVGNAVPPRIAKLFAESIRLAFETQHEEFSKQNYKKALVGYYKNNDHLECILKNKLYYVRFDSRAGTFQFPKGSSSPDILLLHHGTELHAYQLKKIEPIIRTSKELQELGFNPCGEIYLCFLLDETKEINIDEFSINNLSNNQFAPFVIQIEQF